MGGAKHMRKRIRYCAALAAVSLMPVGVAHAATFVFVSSGPITISGITPTTAGSPYPSTISVSGVTGTVTNVTVTLGNLNKSSSLKDLDFLLVSPQNEKLLLLSDAGFGSSTSVVLTFDDAASGPIPLFMSPISSGTYMPTNYAYNEMGIAFCSGEPSDDIFTPPAPTGPYGSTLSIFDGDDPNGTWSLYIVNDCPGTGESTLGNWSIAFTTEPTAARMASFSAAAGKSGVAVRWRTASEVDVLGFNVYRKTTLGPLRKVNRSVVTARGGATGASYRFIDRSTRPGLAYTYRLQLVGLDGTRSWYGSVHVRARRA